MRRMFGFLIGIFTGALVGGVMALLLAPESGETLEEAENELGVADWVDPDTGELAEGLSTPRQHGE